MNKLIITIITTLLLTVAGTALAQDFYGEPGKKGHRQQRGMPEMPIFEQLMRGIKRLDLDDEQKVSIKSVMEGLKAEVRPIMAETRAGHVQLKELVRAEIYDEQAISALAEKEGSLAAERLIVSSRALSKVFGYLTDEQRAQLDAMAAERGKRQGKKRQQQTAEG